MLKIDPTAVISPLADIERSVRGTLIEIGPRVLIDSFVKIKAVGGSGEVIIGADSAVNSGTVIYTGNGVRLGEAVLIAANCTLAPTNHEIADRDRRIRDQGFMESRGGIVIEDASFGARFRARYGNQPAGTPYDVVVDRAGERLTLSTTLQFADVVNARIQEAADANEKALRIRNGILTGSTGR